MVCHHPDKFGDHRSCDSVDIMSLTSHVTVLLKGYVNLWVEPLAVNHHLAMFDGHCSSAGRAKKYLICHEILHEQEI